LEIWIVSLREVEHLLDEKHGDDLVIREREITPSPLFYFSIPTSLFLKQPTQILDTTD